MMRWGRLFFPLYNYLTWSIGSTGNQWSCRSGRGSDGLTVTMTETQADGQTDGRGGRRMEWGGVKMANQEEMWINQSERKQQGPEPSCRRVGHRCRTPGPVRQQVSQWISHLFVHSRGDSGGPQTSRQYMSINWKKHHERRRWRCFIIYHHATSNNADRHMYEGQE